jgi:hypothetical protein
MVQTTPYNLVLKLSRDNEKLAGSDFALRKRKKSPLKRYTAKKGLRIII